jgi:hypothetical protein
MLATAPPARRFLLVEVPGPWGHGGLLASRLDPRVARELDQRAAVAGLRVLLIRRPGRHVDDGVAGGHGPAGARHRVAVVDTPGAFGPGGATASVRWSDWSDPAELLDLRLEPGADVSSGSGRGPQRVALVCAHSRRDLCCAVRGRPVAARLAAGATGWDVWESSHLGGHRFAASVLALPHGDLFGGLGVDGEQGDAAEVLASLDAGRIDLAHYRGRCGVPPVQAAAVHHAMSRLGENRRDAVTVLRDVPPGTAPAVHQVIVRHRTGAAGAAGVGVTEAVDLVVTVRESQSDPALMSCSAVTLEPFRRLDLMDLRPA